jgi:hypothetical protein
MSPLQTVKPKQFQVRLASLGTDSCNSNIEKLTDKNAARLLFRTVVIMAREMVGKDHSIQICYDLAVDILSELRKEPENFNLVEEIKNWKQEIKEEKWGII